MEKLKWLENGKISKRKFTTTNKSVPDDLEIEAIKEIFLQELQNKFEEGTLETFVTRIREVEAKQRIAFFPDFIAATSGKMATKNNNK